MGRISSQPDEPERTDMPDLPGFVIVQLGPFAPAIYRKSTWQKAEALVAGAILTTDKRTVSAVLRVRELSSERNYPKYRQVLNRRSVGDWKSA